MNVSVYALRTEKHMRLIFLSTALLVTSSLSAADVVLLSKMSHLRIDGAREWSDFPETPEADKLELKFQSKSNSKVYSLSIRQQDIKQSWRVSLNGKELGRLSRDENDMLVYFDIPAKTLTDGENLLLVEQTGRKAADDVRVGQITLYPRPKSEVLSEAAIPVTVKNWHNGDPTPCRITVINNSGCLQTVGTPPDNKLAIREGVVYSATGNAVIRVPHGQYTIYAGRGMEWSVESSVVDVTTRELVPVKLAIKHEVDTTGFVSCDTHVHTFTHSRHGDSSIQERMVTLAGEGIEFPIATDHNIHIDYEPLSRELGVRKYFTPVIGNEVTTKIGHFNVFPIQSGAKIPDYKLMKWDDIFSSIFATPKVSAVIINHARDIHSGVRPFGPKLHNALVGRNLEGWKLQANAMELINSGATQTDPMRLYHDWFGLLNRGH